MGQVNFLTQSSLVYLGFLGHYEGGKTEREVEIGGGLGNRKKVEGQVVSSASLYPA